MNWWRRWPQRAPILFLLISLVGAACATPATPTPTTTPKPAASGFARPDLLVETDWLAQRVDDPSIRIVDVRKPADYEAGHIKNAVNLNASDFKGQLYDQNAPVKWTVLTKPQLETLMGDLGIGNNTTVVAVDDSTLWAARLFWTLEYYGHGDGKVRVLNGGMKKWKAENKGLTTEATKITKATFVANPQPNRLATKQIILDNLGKQATTILATIPEAEFKGGNAANAKRGGHIPGAKQLDWPANLTTGDVPVFKSAAELATLYQTTGVTKDKNTILY